MLLHEWREALRVDSSLTAGDALPRVQLYDHVPSLLAAFEQALLRLADGAAREERHASANAGSAHGMHRWQQGYDLREVTRELGTLNAVVVKELDAYAMANPGASLKTMAVARRTWAVACASSIEESTSEFFRLQRTEAAGHVKDLEDALSEVSEVEQQRAELWRQLAHDLRGNVSVVSTAAKALTLSNAPAASRDRFVRMLERNLDSLRHLLDDVTSLTRLQAGKEHRELSQVDASALLTQLCEGLQALARQRDLQLRYSGPSLIVQGDGVKVRRLAQNLILNALKYTAEGGVDVTWAPCETDDAKRWMLTVRDTGPGIDAGPGSPLVVALKDATDLAQDVAADAPSTSAEPASPERLSGERESEVDRRPVRQAHGEGIGLSIVKRLADLLDATIEVESDGKRGTTFRILLPRAYEQG